MVKEVLPGAGRRPIDDVPPEIRLLSPRLNEPVVHVLSAGRTRHAASHQPAMANHLSSLPPCIGETRTAPNIKIHLFHALYRLQRPIQAFFACLNKPSRPPRRTPSQSSAPASDDSTTVKCNSSYPDPLNLPFPNLSLIIFRR